MMMKKVKVLEFDLLNNSTISVIPEVCWILLPIESIRMMIYLTKRGTGP